MAVMPLDGFHQGKQDRHGDDHQIRAVGELGDQDDNEDQSRKERPTALINRARRSRDRPSGGVVRSRTVQCRTIPAWLSVRANTPMM